MKTTIKGNINVEMKEKFPGLFAEYIKKHTEACEAEKAFYAGKGSEYFGIANRLGASADTLYQNMRNRIID